MKYFFIILLIFSSQTYANDYTELTKKFLVYSDIFNWIDGRNTRVDWNNEVDRKAVLKNPPVTGAKLHYDYVSNIYNASENYGKTPQWVKAAVAQVMVGDDGNPVVSFMTSDYLDSFIVGGLSKGDVVNLNRGSLLDLVCFDFNLKDQVLYSNSCITKDDFIRKVSSNLVDKIGTKKWTISANSSFFGNVDIVLDSYTKDIIKTDFINKCKDQPYYEPTCFNEAKNRLKVAYDAFEKDLSANLSCYEKDKNCNDALKFSQKFNFDYLDVVAENKRIEKEGVDKKRKEIIGKLTNFLKN